MTHQNVRNTLLNRAVTVIATDGLDKTTTKAIVSGTGINEVYIYRQFVDKDDLLSKTFDMLDDELLLKTMQHVEVMYCSDIDYELRCRVFFEAIWKFLIGNKEKCLAFMRYYYSPYFTRYSVESHTQRFLPLVEKFNPAFKSEADVWMILNHILHVMLAFAVMVHNEQMPKDEDYSEHVFRVIYASVKQYFKIEEGNT